jgi:class 3 adenylate cyclase
MSEAAEAAQLIRRSWFKQSVGDEELALLPSTEPEPRVVDDFVRELDAALRRHNSGLEPGHRLRLRVGIHYGVAFPAPNGLAGQAVVAVSRLVDCGPLRAAIAAADEANMALILSRRVYEETVQQGHTSHRPEEFRRVSVRLKEYSGEAWIRVPGADVHQLNLSADPHLESPGAAPHRRSAARDPAVVNEFNQAVDARGAVFGIKYR